MIRVYLAVMTISVLFTTSSVKALEDSQQFNDVVYKDLISDEDGFLSNTSGDGFLVLNNIDLTRAQMCGLLLNLEFKVTPERATIFDLYWRTAKTGFAESQKGFFIVNQADAASSNRYLVPLCKLFNFSGNLNQPMQQANIASFRFDFPTNKTLALRIESIDFIASTQAAALTSEDHDVIVVEPYERIAAHSFSSLDVIIPKLIFAFEEGIQRLTKDVPFLLCWLLVILVLKVLILTSFMRQFKTDKERDN